MAVMGLTAALLTLSGCPKTPKTATQTAAVPGAEQPAPSPPVVEEVAPPIVAEERWPEPPSAETRAAALADVYFEFDRAEVTPRRANRVGRERQGGFSAASNSAVTIEGHADERGTNEYNLRLASGARRR
jgi:peptidoglycan-associated lipoprotein